MGLSNEMANETLGVSNENLGVSKENLWILKKIWGLQLIYLGLLWKSGGRQRKSWV